MDFSVAAIAIGALLTLTGAAALLVKRSPARVRAVTGDHPLELSALGLSHGGEHATIVQFSTEMCARCPGVRRAITSLVTPGVEFAHVDVTHRPEIVAQFRLRQTPTVLILDPAGRPRARLTGAVSREALAQELAAYTGGSIVAP